jgi:hypothetical protein
MGNTTVGVLIPETIMTVEAMGHVISTKKCHFGRINESLAAQHLDIRPGDKEDRRASPGRGRNSVNGLISTYRNDGM